MLVNIRLNAKFAESKYSPVGESEYVHANLCEYFEANMKRLMRINGVGVYTETCEYEVSEKDQYSLGFASKRIKKITNTAHPSSMAICNSVFEYKPRRAASNRTPSRTEEQIQE